MATAKITKLVVERLPADGKWLWDTTLQGFGVRRQKGGAFYYVRYRLGGGQRIKSLGLHGHLTPDTARAQALAALGKAAVGVDPFPEAAPVAESFGAGVERYLAQRKLKLKPRSFVEVERHLRKDAKPLVTAKLNAIDRRKIAVLLGGIETTNGPFARNQVRASLSAFFSWTVKEGLLETNPVTATAKAEGSGPRDRVLSQEELVTIWRGLGEDRFSNIVRLLILTGQRRNEIGGLRLSEIDLDRGLIVLPPARTKNKRQHELPLSPQASAILRRAINGVAHNAKLDRNGNGNGKANDVGMFGVNGFGGWFDYKASLDRRVGLAQWRLHDLRRTAATMMAELGVLPHIIEAILNHVSGHKSGVAGIYNRAKYEGEMRAALCKWADYVEGLMATSTVTTFQPRQASAV
ncbi:MAG: site-specific integrase [Pseudolabrys sp.]